MLTSKDVVFFKDALLGIASFVIICFDITISCCFNKELTAFAEAVGYASAIHLFGAVALPFAKGFIVNQNQSTILQQQGNKEGDAQ